MQALRTRAVLTIGTLLAAVTAISCARETETAPPVAVPAIALGNTRAIAGGPLTIAYTFTVPPGGAALPADAWVFVHMLDARKELLWTDDHAPATPTQGWRPGTTVSYTRTTFVPRSTPPGDVRIEIGLFTPKSGERLPLSGRDQGMRSYEVATFAVLPNTSNLVVTGEGWHDPETGDGPGREWQWSRREGHISFRNPKRPVTVYLEVDQPVKAFPSSQTVEVRGPSGVLTTFEVPPGAPRLSRLPVSVDQLGTDEVVDLTIVPSGTFVPASVPSLKSADTRELGIRLLNAFVEPAEGAQGP
jgi:hypothetical protein